MPSLSVGDNFLMGGVRQGVVGPDNIVHPVAEAKKKIENGDWPNCCLEQDEAGKFHLNVN
ncbi:MAG: hypothetical protein Q8N55_01255 [bacterium]|nr:hypothetical protein [bacterium]